MEGAGYFWGSWADVLEPGQGTETLAVYADQFYAGKAAVVTRPLGRGTVTYIGADSLDGSLEKDVIRAVYRRAGVAIDDLPPGVYIEWRDGFFVAVNYSSSVVPIPVEPGARIFLGANPLRPAEVLVWKE